MTPDPISDTNKINPAFRQLGIPTSWLKLRRNTRLPSQKTTAFLLSSASLIALYFYDRYQSKMIKLEYIERVRHLSDSLVSSELSLHPMAWMPRKVNVYGARVPEDVDVDRGTQWFKRYVKPILVAAAIDYTIHNGTTPGALARKISDDIRDQRLISAAQLHQASTGSHQASLKPGMPGFREWHAEQHKLEGGSLILGRNTLKEYLWGLKDGYKRKIPIDKLDDDERFSKQLEETGIFDTPSSTLDEESSESQQFASSADLLQDLTTPHRPLNDQLDAHHDDSLSSASGLGLSHCSDKTTTSRIFNFFSRSTPTPSSSSSSSSSINWNGLVDTTETLRPTLIPPQPPLLLVPFDHPIGIRWWPLKIYRFFNQRYQVELGATTAMKLIDCHTRPIEPAKNHEDGILNLDQDSLNGGRIDCLKLENIEDLYSFDNKIKLTGSRDLDFLAPEADLHLRKSYQKAPEKIIEERNYYRKELQNKLKIARREQEKVEEEHSRINDHPETQLNESQLRLEAFQKEKKWNDLLKAWFIVRRSSGISWHSDMALALRIFDHPHHLTHDDNSRSPSEFQ